jgi:DNA-binding CsgD family transcriptional regulator
MTMTTASKARIQAAEKRTVRALVRCVGEQQIPYRREALAVMARYVVRDQLTDWPPLPDIADLEPPPAPVPAVRPRVELAPSDVLVLRLLAEGDDAAEVGRRLGVSESAVKRRLRRLYAALGARNRTHAVALAYESGALATGALGSGGVVAGSVWPCAASVAVRRRPGAPGASAGRTAPREAAAPGGRPRTGPDGPSAALEAASAGTARSGAEIGPQRAAQAVSS